MLLIELPDEQDVQAHYQQLSCRSPAQPPYLTGSAQARAHFGNHRAGGQRSHSRGMDETVVQDLAGVPQAVADLRQHQPEGLGQGDDAVELPEVLALALLRQAVGVCALLVMDLLGQILATWHVMCLNKWRGSCSGSRVIAGIYIWNGLMGKVTRAAAQMQAMPKWLDFDAAF